tara:strand:- start:1048 stop:1239 length:192 start_codon:yes stop_codon:yes gene_type:complete
MKKALFVLVILLITSCSKTNCNEEMAKLQTLRSQGWQNCNGAKACTEKIEADYSKRVNELDCE